MSLIDIATLLQETGSELRMAEVNLAANPDDFAAIVNTQSLLKRQQNLQVQFQVAAAAHKMEVLYYRFIPKTLEPPIRALNDVLGSFQQAFSVLFDSITTHTKKARARISEASSKASSLSFAYSYSGSVGFALTLPQELVLVGSVEHLTAIDAIRRLATVRSRDDVKAFSDTYGIAAVRSIYQWLDAVAKYDMDSEVSWANPNQHLDEFLIQVPEAQAARSLIASVSVTETTDRSYRGTLLGYDSDRKTFRFAIGDRKPIYGSVSSSVSAQLTVPAVYAIRVRVTITSRYSTEDKEEQFELLSIERSSTNSKK